MSHAALLDPDAHKVQRPRVMELHETNPGVGGWGNRTSDATRIV